MKLLIWILLLGCMSCAGKPKGFNFKLEGDFINVDTATVQLITPDDEPRVLLSTKMKDGKFLLQGTLPEPGFYFIKLGDRRVAIMLDSSDMYWPSDYNMVDPRYLKNSPATRTMLDIHGLIREQYEIPTRVLFDQFDREAKIKKPTVEEEAEVERQAVRNFEQRGDLILDYVKKHANDLYMPVFIQQQISGYDYAWGKKGYDLLSPEMQASQPGRILKEKLDNQSHTAVGTALPVFAVQDAEGKMIDLKLGDGKVYVIDFWASWCGPCRAMMQELKKLYKGYDGKPVDFISISLDSKEKDWLPANEQEQIPWASYWIKENFKSKIAKQLGIEAIPFIVVVDQEGKIAGKNLRDQKLVDKVDELLK